MDSRTQATVNTLIPKKDITDFELDLLENFGFSRKEIADEDSYYFYVKNDIRILEDDAEDALDEGEIVIASNVPENKPYFNEEGNFTASETGVNYECVFQNIVKRSDELAFIEIEGAYYTTRPVVREFGGFAAIITADEVISMNTSDFLHGAHAKLAAAEEGISPR